MSPTPLSVFPVNGSNPLQHGISKRELFASMAMQALIRKDQSMSPDFIAEMAVRYADELLSALESKKR